jgi:hypothetical protein
MRLRAGTGRSILSGRSHIGNRMKEPFMVIAIEPRRHRT